MYPLLPSSQRAGREMEMNILYLAESEVAVKLCQSHTFSGLFSEPVLELFLNFTYNVNV